ncbi:unnamed protein product [[Candida] boidinii]|nr:unnamed protein product [[Candida] boidinii]
MKFLNILAFLFSLILTAQAATAPRITSINTNFGCYVPTQYLTNGFDVRLFSYPYLSTFYSSTSFYYTQYTSKGLISTVTGISGVPSFDYTPHGDGRTTNLWGMQFTPENFTMEFTMYFKAPNSGFYDFYFDSIDDGAMAFMGNGAFACCDNADISIAVDGTQMLFATWSSSTGPTGDSASVYLVGEIYYPMRIVFINHQNIGTLSFTLKYGDEELDLKDYLYKTYYGSGCHRFRTS